MPLLDVRDITKSFDQEGHRISILKGVTFTLDAGDSCAIVGPSGSGKTTLIGICAGLDRPTSGVVRLAGADIENWSEDERALFRRSQVGFVFQSFRLIPALTAIENVMVPLELAGKPDARSAAAAALDEVDLSHRLSHYPFQLSGGEQQRVAIARAFAASPALLFADEPTGNLDTENATHVADLLFQLNARKNTALVLVTHNRNLADRARRVFALFDGRLQDGPSL